MVLLLTAVQWMGTAIAHKARLCPDCYTSSIERKRIEPSFLSLKFYHLETTQYNLKINEIPNKF